MYYRPATTADAPALAALGRASFTDAFGHLYRPEDLAAFLEEVHDEAHVRAQITGPATRYRLAVGDDGRLLGYCKISHPSKLAELSAATNPLELSQLYCDSAATGMGIGATLTEWAIAEAEAGGHDAVILSVYSENYGAQRFYQRHGFDWVADTTFKVGEQLDREFLYEKPLTKGPIARPS